MSPSKFLLVISSCVLILLCVVAALYSLFSEDNTGPHENTTTTTFNPASSEETPTTMAVSTPRPIEDIHYYFSDKSYTWDEAHTYCSGIGRHAKLAEFYTKQELRKAAAYIMDSTSGGDFWIGGIYKRSRWEWANGGLVNESITSWEDPHESFTRNSRLGIVLYDRYDVYWASFAKSEHKRLLCQL